MTHNLSIRKYFSYNYLSCQFLEIFKHIEVLLVLLNIIRGSYKAFCHQLLINLKGLWHPLHHLIYSSFPALPVHQQSVHSQNASRDLRAGMFKQELGMGEFSTVDSLISSCHVECWGTSHCCVDKRRTGKNVFRSGWQNVFSISAKVALEISILIG